MTPQDQDIIASLLFRWLIPANWWQEQAKLSISRGWFTIIHGRTDADLYLLRMWLAQPVSDLGNNCHWESGNSVLLHYFPRGDDDESLHDHPWDFTTTILSGGYFEHLPGPMGAWTSAKGPPWNTFRARRIAGDTVHHKAEDLHCVGDLIGSQETWTLMRTGARRREWGFHPHGEAWVPWRQFIDRRKALV